MSLKTQSTSPSLAKVGRRDGPPIVTSQPNLLILLMGGTESGKDEFMGTVCLRANVVSKPRHIHVQTLRIPLSALGPAAIKRPGNLILVQVPAFDRTFSVNVDVLQEMMDILVEEHFRGTIIAGAVHLHSISQKRVLEADRTDMRVLQSILGDHFCYPGLFFVTMHWGSDASTILHGQEREKGLIDDLWKPFVEKGAQVVRIEDESACTSQGAVGILADLIFPFLAPQAPILADRPIPLVLHEVVIGLEILDTTAGKTLSLIFQESEDAHRANFLDLDSPGVFGEVRHLRRKETCWAFAFARLEWATLYF